MNGGRTFGRYPAVLKTRGDHFFTEGIYNLLQPAVFDKLIDWSNHPDEK